MSRDRILAILLLVLLAWVIPPRLGLASFGGRHVTDPLRIATVRMPAAANTFTVEDSGGTDAFVCDGGTDTCTFANPPTYTTDYNGYLQAIPTGYATGGSYVNTLNAFSGYQMDPATAGDCVGYSFTVPGDSNALTATFGMQIQFIAEGAGGAAATVVIDIHVSQLLNSANPANTYRDAISQHAVDATIAANDMVFDTEAVTGIVATPGGTYAIRLCRIGSDAADDYASNIVMMPPRIVYDVIR